MKGALRSGGLRRSFVLVVIAISILLLSGQLLLQRYFVDYVGKIYRDDVDSVMERITHEVRTTFMQMNEAVSSIAENTAVQDYVVTEDTSQRYRKVFEAVRPIVQISTQNLGFDHFLLSDATDSWYRFFGSLSNASCQTLKELISKNWGISNLVVTLEGRTYFCTGQPIVLIQGYRPLMKGMVVALIDVDKTRLLLRDYGNFKGLAIRLHNYQDVLISNDRASEGKVLAALDQPARDYLGRNGDILPGVLGITISIPRSMIFPQRQILGLTIFSVGLFALLSIIIVAFVINRWIIVPVMKVTEGSTRLDESDLGLRLAPTGVGYIDTLVKAINGMLARLEDYNRGALEARERLYRSELNRQKILMHLLKNQISGHFLYNSLGSVKSLADMGEAEKAGEVSSGLAHLLRYTSSPEEVVNLFEEMDVVQRYVRIQNIRFSGKFQLEMDVDDRLCEYGILKLIIQPLVENALVHGLEGSGSPARLHVRGQLVEGGIRIEVEDEGVGIPAARLDELAANIRRSAEGGEIDPGIEGIALMNIQKRMSLAYGPGYGLEVESEEGIYTRVSLFLPALRHGSPG